MKKLSIFVFVSFASMLGWAFTADHFAKNYQRELINSAWQVKKMQYKSTYAIINFKKPYTVNFSDDNVSFQLEKNQCGAELLLAANTFRIGDQGGICSTMCCDSPQGSKFAQALTSKLVKKYQIKGNQLIIKDKNYTFWLEKLKK
ncbi:hypothetical protein BKI52_37270 [marine bacterium AO1-C]|nr:hypothetical protein BKI52_37270 [marine bacterium AO1-C]